MNPNQLHSALYLKNIAPYLKSIALYLKSIALYLKSIALYLINIALYLKSIALYLKSIGTNYYYKTLIVNHLYIKKFNRYPLWQRKVI